MMNNKTVDNRIYSSFFFSFFGFPLQNIVSYLSLSIGVTNLNVWLAEF